MTAASSFFRSSCIEGREQKPPAFTAQIPGTERRLPRTMTMYPMRIRLQFRDGIFPFFPAPELNDQCPSLHGSEQDMPCKGK